MWSRFASIAVAVSALISLSLATSDPQVAAGFVVPDLELQEAIRDVAPLLVGRDAKENIEAIMRPLRQKAQSEARLLEQALYYARFGATGEREAYGALVLLSIVKLDRKEKIATAVRYLETTDQKARTLVESVLQSADEPLVGGGPDLSLYEPVLHHGTETAHLELIDYMYRRDPQQAMLTLARVYSPNVPQRELKEQLVAEPRKLLSYLANRLEWWAHLYVAKVLDQKPDLLTPELLRALDADKHPLVAEMVRNLQLVPTQPQTQKSEPSE